MRRFFRNNSKLIIVAAVFLTVGLATPAIGHGVHASFAHNAHKVDGRHAVGAGASIDKRAGKLVATNKKGRLPNNIIKKARDANKLDGLDSSAFATASELSGVSAELSQLEALLLTVRSDLRKVRHIETGNGVGSNFGCPSGNLGVSISNGWGESVDDRFTFVVPGSTGAWGQVRTSASLRTSSANVSGATNPSNGVFCVSFTSLSGLDLEGTVVSIHLN